MHTDAQSDRRQRCPLQFQRTHHRVACARERQHKTVTLALLDRTHTTMGGDQVSKRGIEPCDRGRHRLRLALPQPR